MPPLARTTGSYPVALCSPGLRIILRLHACSGLVLQKCDQQLHAGESAPLTSVRVRDGRQPDQVSIVACLPQTQHVGNVAWVFVVHRDALSSAAPLRTDGAGAD